MFVRNPAVRWFVVGLAAYALVFHALLVGVASAPRTSAENNLIAALQEICTGVGGPSETTPLNPASSKVHSAPCALCGLGHAAVDLPAMVRIAAPANIVESLAFAPTPPSFRPHFEFLAAARPRAPPAFV